MLEYKIKEVSIEDDTEPVTLDEAKQYLDVDFTEDDARITTMISAARAMVENYINRDVLPRLREYFIVKLQGETIDLPYAPINASNSISVEIDGVATQEDDGWERVGVSDDPYLKFDNPYAENVSIDYYTEGLAGNTTVKQGMLEILYAMYNDMDLKPHVWAPLKPLKRYVI